MRFVSNSASVEMSFPLSGSHEMGDKETHQVAESTYAHAQALLTTTMAGAAGDASAVTNQLEWYEEPFLGKTDTVMKGMPNLKSGIPPRPGNNKPPRVLAHSALLVVFP
ncbi:hypothetical protein ColTof4_04205 [Colletotrichum tofieldiae]|nr:hypothetical protein ColTof3_14054 [Colletotrichum tofieldiae]GKT71782.1 hypothetical protein ColTof4_04205 [Colletotrichum tofieldiae]